MRTIIYFYYIAFLLTGGFRNYFEELALHDICLGLNTSSFVKMSIQGMEFVCLLLALIILILPMKRYLHLLFFGVYFVLDIYVQNFVYLERYLALVNFFPFIVFLFLTYKDEKEKYDRTREILIKIVAIGYFTAFIGKISIDYLNPKHLLVYNYLAVIDQSNSLSLALTKWFLSIQHFGFYKSVDYFIMLLLGSSLFMFFKPKVFKWYSIVLIIYIIILALFLNLSYFYPFILIYALILNSRNVNYIFSERIEDYLGYVFAGIFLVFFVLNGFDRFFVLRHFSTSIYLYLGLLSTFVCTFVFMMTWIHKYLRKEKRKKHRHHKKSKENASASLQ